jgi:integrase/recombinase XerD
LVASNKRFENTIENIHIKGVKQEVIHNILTSDELEDLYYSYSNFPLRGNVRRTMGNKRNKIIVGLLVYQGLTTSNLNNLKTENIQLYKGKIDILGTRKSNGRLLELKPWQLMELMEYINEIRPKILEEREKYSSLREDAVGRRDEQLLLPLGTSLNLQNILAKITKELREINNKFKNTKQLRTSVIINWLKQYNFST